MMDDLLYHTDVSDDTREMLLRGEPIPVFQFRVTLTKTGVSIESALDDEDDYSPETLTLRNTAVKRIVGAGCEVPFPDHLFSRLMNATKDVYIPDDARLVVAEYTILSSIRDNGTFRVQMAFKPGSEKCPEDLRDFLQYVGSVMFEEYQKCVRDE